MNGLSFLLISVFLLSILSFLLSLFRGLETNMVFYLDALMIANGGTILAIFVSYPFKRIKRIIHLLTESFKGGSGREKLINEILRVSGTYRTEGIIELEKSLKNINNDFLRFGVSLIVNSNRNGDIRNIMEREMASKISEYVSGRHMLKTAAVTITSLGIAGTVLCVIKIFLNSISPESMTTFTAVSLISAFYGIVISNIFLLPLAERLRERSMSKEIEMDIIIEGVVAVNNLDHPLKVEEMIRSMEPEAEITGAGRHFGVSTVSETLV